MLVVSLPPGYHTCRRCCDDYAIFAAASAADADAAQRRADCVFALLPFALFAIAASSSFTICLIAAAAA